MHAARSISGCAIVGASPLAPSATGAAGATAPNHAEQRRDRNDAQDMQRRFAAVGSQPADGGKRPPRRLIPEIIY
ncbi:hypothetical protein CAL14_18460 [Bordetella genomosp. 9]|nr:hypothetical protein CAL14_18460 [Bordetella genomosp. 9]